MKLQDQVCSLELSKKLKELGVNKESYWYWHKGELEDEDDLDDWAENHLGVHENAIHAYTVAELGQMLPKEESIVTMIFTNSRCQMAILGYEWKDKSIGQSIEADTEADARAKMLIYLLENNLIENK